MQSSRLSKRSVCQNTTRVGGRGLTTRSLLLGMMAATALPLATQSAAAQSTQQFGELELFDFNTFAGPQSYQWTSGDALITDIDLSTRIGAITGRKNQRITPAIKAWGVTIIPEVRADTRSGARLTSSFTGQAGVELNAGLTVGGDGFQAAVQAGPTLDIPGQVVPGEFFGLRGGTTIGSQSNFDPGLPTLNAGLDIVMNGDFNNKFEYGLFPVAKYSVGNFGFDFDLGFNLFDFNLDLNLPELPSINFPDLPNFVIPPDVDDNTLLRQKLPPSNPAINVAELAIDNPLKSISTDFDITPDGRLTTATKGSVTRAGLDIDGVASALATGVSFTGTSAKVGPGRIGYDLIDVKYGLELGIEYDTEIDTFINATLNFDKPVLVKNEDGSTQEVTSYTGRWDQLPSFALLTREDVNVDVDFTDIEAIFKHSGGLTLSDYMELQALSAEVKVGPLKLVDIGPLLYKKFPLAGELAEFELFSDTFSLGSLNLADGIWDGSFVIENTPVRDVAITSTQANLDTSSGLVFVDTRTGTSLSQDTNLVIGQHEGGDTSRADLSAITYRDPGAVQNAVLTTVWDVNVRFLGLPQRISTEFRSTGADIANPNAVTSINALVVIEDSQYVLERGGFRRFELNRIENNGTISGEGLLGFTAAGDTLEIVGDGTIKFVAPGEIVAQTLVHGEGHAIQFLGFDPFSTTAGPQATDFPDVPIAPTGREHEFVEYRVNGSRYNPSSPIDNPVIRSEFVFDVDTLDNAGRITFLDGNTRGNAEFNIQQLINRPTGVIEVLRGVEAEIGNVDGGGVLSNAGDIVVAFSNSFLPSTLAINYNGIESPFGIEPGRIITGDPFSTVVFNSTDDLIVANQDFVNAGTMQFSTSVKMIGQTTFENSATGVATFDDGFEVLDTQAVQFNNAGTLNINGFASLISRESRPGRDGPPTVMPLNLVNTGTINVFDRGTLEFGAIIQNFSGEGAALTDGTWNLLGEAGDFSNLGIPDTKRTPFGDAAGIDLRILEVETEDGAFFDILGGVAQLNTDLKVNAANVQFFGQAYFPYFNTVEINRGNLTIAGGHQFTTAGQLITDEGTTTVESGGDLFVQGALKVLGGNVSIDATSTFTAQTQTEIIDDDDNTRDVTVEVIGGSLDLADASFLAGTDMFTDISEFSGPDLVQLNAGQSWIVREQAVFDEETGDFISAIGGQIDLGGVFININAGSITLDGVDSVFDAAEGMTVNRGTLLLETGYAFESRTGSFTNDAGATMSIQAASFTADQPGSVFTNRGTLTMDGDSYLMVEQFVNHTGATLQLDGVLDAQQVLIEIDSSITGAGTITGSIVNNGLLDLGNSPGLIQTFGSYTQGADASSLFEILGLEPGTEYDQLILRRVLAVEGEAEEQPPVFVTLAGELQLTFDSGLNVPYGYEWLLIDNQGESAILGGFDPVDVVATGLIFDDPTDTNGVDTTGDIYLGDLDGFSLFLSATGGDGNDLTVYAVPEPSTLIVAGLGGMMLLGRRRRRNAA